MHDNARRYSSRINQLTDLPVNIRAVTQNNTTVFRVEVGPFETQASLNSTQKQLEKQGVKNITARFS
jgi:cell division protein FtsN